MNLYLQLTVRDENGKERAHVGISDFAVLMDALDNSPHPLLRKAAELLREQLPKPKG